MLGAAKWQQTLTHLFSHVRRGKNQENNQASKQAGWPANSILSQDGSRCNGNGNGAIAAINNDITERRAIE